jgi:hypothetical protein
MDKQWILAPAVVAILGMLGCGPNPTAVHDAIVSLDPVQHEKGDRYFQRAHWIYIEACGEAFPTPRIMAYLGAQNPSQTFAQILISELDKKPTVTPRMEVAKRDLSRLDKEF